MLETARLLLRPWQPSDHAPFAAMSADPQVMRYLVNPATREAVGPWIERQMAHYRDHGFGFLAAEERASGAFVGVVGLMHVPYEAHFTPAVEVGWRLARPFWGRGYAPEAARAWLQWGFKTLGLAEIVANTCVENRNSRQVMEKLGMTRNPSDDYDHPQIAAHVPERRQVLYRLACEKQPAS